MALRYIGTSDIEKYLAHHTGDTEKLDAMAKFLDGTLPLPHTGPVGLFEISVQCLRTYGFNAKVDYCMALAETIEKLGDSRIEVAVNFDVSQVQPHSVGPDHGCWFTRLFASKLFFFWHPDPSFKYSRLHVVHYGRGKDIYSRMRTQSALLSGIVTRA